jgi:hypothetical protein
VLNVSISFTPEMEDRRLSMAKQMRFVRGVQMLPSEDDREHVRDEDDPVFFEV